MALVPLPALQPPSPPPPAPSHTDLTDVACFHPGSQPCRSSDMSSLSLLLFVCFCPGYPCPDTTTFWQPGYRPHSCPLSCINLASSPSLTPPSPLTSEPCLPDSSPLLFCGWDCYLVASSHDSWGLHSCDPGVSSPPHISASSRTPWSLGFHCCQ